MAMLSDCLMDPNLFGPFFECKDTIEACEMLVDCGIIEVLKPLLDARLPREHVDLDRTWPSVKYHVLTLIATLSGIVLCLFLCLKL